MKIAIYTSDMGGSPLYGGLIRGMQQLGHEVLMCNRHGSYDLVLMFNQSAHTTGYSYPDFPMNNSPIAFIDSAEYGYFKRLPEVAHDYANTFSEGSLNHDTKNKTEQLRLKEFLQGKSFPYFMREYLKGIDWPESYHPIDYPLYHLSKWNYQPNKDEYIKRNMDLFVFWGGSHPWRLNITEELRKAKVKSDINIIHDTNNPRRPQHEYFRRTQEAKATVSFDGYGSSSFRLTEAIVRTLLLRGPLRIKLRDDLTPGINVLDYEVITEGENFVSTNINHVLQNAIADPEGSFRIYEAGYEHCMQHWTEKATAQYLLDIVDKHDYSSPTPLDL